MQYAGVDYNEAIPGSPDETVIADNSHATYEIFTDWSDRWAAAQAFIGYSIVETEVSTFTNKQVNYITRQLPFRYPHPTQQDSLLTPGIGTVLYPFLYCNGVQRTEGIGPDGVDTSTSPGLAQYVKARLTLSMFAPKYAILPDKQVLGGDGSPLEGYPDEGYALANASGYPGSGERYVTRTTLPAGRMLSIGPGVFKTAPAGAVGAGVQSIIVPGGFAKKIENLSITYTWHDVPANGYPMLAIQQCLGCLNDDIFDGYPAGTLRLEHVEPITGISPYGQFKLDVRYEMRFEPNINSAGSPLGHNAIYCGSPVPGVGTKYDWWTLTTTGNPPTGPYDTVNVTPYRSADFTSLFRPDQPPMEG